MNRILKCFALTSDGFAITCDGVEYKENLWLVPRWIDHPTELTSSPERILRFDCFQHQPDPTGEFDYQNILLPITASALNGVLPPGIEHEDRPQNLVVDIRDVQKHQWKPPPPRNRS